MSDFLLQTRALTKRFGKHEAVKNVSLNVLPKTVYGLLGPNGAGKSTTLKMLTGMIRPSKGEIVLFGEHWHRGLLRQIGALIEAPALYGNLTAYENLQIHCNLMGLPSQEIDRVLEVVALTDTGKKRTSQFSTGMKQRLGIAIALLGEPRLLILDEPTNGLDPLGIQELRKLISTFPAQGITVIISTHILGEVGQIVDQIGIISDGELKYEGKVDPHTDLEALFINTVQGGKQ